jgi:hypothetical protein
MRTPLILIGLFTSMVLPAQERPNIDGKWEVHISMAGRENDQTCTFSMARTNITGTCLAHEGDFQPQGPLQVTGSLVGNRLTWQYEWKYSEDTFTSTFVGTVKDSNKIAGTVEIQPLGFDGDFTAIPLHTQ